MGIFRGGQPHKLTREERSRGGKKMTEKKRIALAFNRRKYCSEKCPFWDYCPFKYQSFSSNDGQCALKTLPLQLQHNIVKMLNERGMRDILKEIYSIEYAKKISNDRKRERLLKQGMELYKTLYGDKRQVDVKGDMNIDFEKLRQIYEEAKQSDNNGNKN